MEVVDSVLRLIHAFASLARETVSSFLSVDYLDHMLKQDVVNAHALQC